MLIKLDNPASFLRSIEIISELVTEGRIKIGEYGLSITAIDPANVAMVSYRIPRSSFSEFEAEAVEETLGVNLDSLKKVLKRCGSRSSLILKKNGNLLEIDILDRIKRNFSLNLIEIESEDKKMPNLEYSSIVEISSIDLIASIEDCAVVADACSFEIKNGKFIIEAKNIDSARSEFSGDEVKIQAEESKSKYSLEYMQKFLKGAKMSEKTILRFANDHPLKMDFRTEHMELSFILAPRVETED